MFKRILRWGAIGAISAIGLASAAYFWDMNRASQRIQGKSRVLSSPYGEIEYAEGGAGPAVLVIHGSGGGFDQGELLARAVLDDRFRWIAPSRFGYLRSTFHEGATFDHQAQAYAYLLDQLGIKQVAVVALSHGGPSALLFAVLYPERVSSLTLISCGIASSATQDQTEANQKGDRLTTIFKHDPLYWGITKLFRKQFMNLMGADSEVVASLTAEQRKLVDQLIDGMNPVSLRSAGVAFDNKATMPNERIAAIRSPTLIFHATDDNLQLFHNAEFAAATITGAKLVQFRKGGHLLLSVEQATIRSIAQKFMLDHVGK